MKTNYSDTHVLICQNECLLTLNFDVSSESLLKCSDEGREVKQKYGFLLRQRRAWEGVQEPLGNRSVQRSHHRGRSLLKSTDLNYQKNKH